MPYHLATAQKQRGAAGRLKGGGPAYTQRKKKTAQRRGCAVFGGVPRGIRTLGLQSHNLAR